MQLSVSSGKNGLIQRATFLAFGDSADHTADWPLADLVVSLNRWQHEVASWIFQAVGHWEFDDSNNTDLPIATTTLVDGQQDYAFPAGLIKLHRVEVKDNNGNWHKLIPIDQSEVGVALTEYNETDGLPTQYDPIGNSLFLYPAPAAGSVTTSGGLKVYYSREMDEFTTPASYTTADTTQPGFDEMFHDILPLGSAFDWCSVNGPDERANRYDLLIQRKRSDLINSYGNKSKDKKVRLNPKLDSYN